MTVDRYALSRVADPPAAPERGRHRRDRRELRALEDAVDSLPPAGARTPWLPVLGVVAVSLGVAVAVWASTRVHAGPGLQRGALFVHLASLVFGFGAVLAVDWVALLWVLRRRPLGDVLRTSRNAHLPAWLGYAGLLASGALLEPDLSSWATRVKLALVVVIGWNGVVATMLQAPLNQVAERPGRPDRRVLIACGALTLLSQLGWWGAMAIGFAKTG